MKPESRSRTASLWEVCNDETLRFMVTDLFAIQLCRCFRTNDWLLVPGGTCGAIITGQLLGLY
jgi:hypothetical protein